MSHSLAKLHLIEGERNKEDHTIALRKQNEFLQSQLEMVFLENLVLVEVHTNLKLFS